MPLAQETVALEPPPALVVVPAQPKHLRCSPRLVMEQCEQTCFPQAPQLVPLVSDISSTSIVMPSSSPPSSCPQSSHSVGVSIVVGGRHVAGGADGREGRLQKLWRYIVLLLVFYSIQGLTYDALDVQKDDCPETASSGETGQFAAKAKLSVSIETLVDWGEKEPNLGGELNVLVVDVDSSDSERLRFSCMMTEGRRFTSMLKDLYNISYEWVAINAEEKEYGTYQDIGASVATDVTRTRYMYAIARPAPPTRVKRFASFIPTLAFSGNRIRE
ncbi:hypothetical protein E0Z10_g3044 [Xylaria hypoxylon]|uniref:Uncharacterized protein n=1 Tax=Xylaria hypoxylon TaxID=37992 RepID=A0A4Z0YN27_9PEZI|nr:hypothetical protein E0Z10_g3044 [Xylaria hypoxylon]